MRTSGMPQIFQQALQKLAAFQTARSLRVAEVGARRQVAAVYDSEAMEIGFNARYLSDILGQVDGDTVELHLADANAPTLIRESEKSPALYVLMPMRV